MWRVRPAGQLLLARLFAGRLPARPPCGGMAISCKLALLRSLHVLPAAGALRTGWLRLVRAAVRVRVLAFIAKTRQVDGLADPHGGS